MYIFDNEVSCLSHTVIIHHVVWFNETWSDMGKKQVSEISINTWQSLKSPSHGPDLFIIEYQYLLNDSLCDTSREMYRIIRPSRL